MGNGEGCDELLLAFFILVLIVYLLKRKDDSEERQNQLTMTINAQSHYPEVKMVREQKMRLKYPDELGADDEDAEHLPGRKYKVQAVSYKPTSLQERKRSSGSVVILQQGDSKSHSDEELMMHNARPSFLEPEDNIQLAFEKAVEQNLASVYQQGADESLPMPLEKKWALLQCAQEANNLHPNETNKQSEFTIHVGVNKKQKEKRRKSSRPQNKLDDNDQSSEVGKLVKQLTYDNMYSSDGGNDTEDNEDDDDDSSGSESDKNDKGQSYDNGSESQEKKIRKFYQSYLNSARKQDQDSDEKEDH